MMAIVITIINVIITVINIFCIVISLNNIREAKEIQKSIEVNNEKFNNK